MSVSGISSSNVFELIQAEKQSNQNGQPAQNPIQQIESDFNQLGQDLQAGNLTQAQQDFATFTSALTSAAQNSSNAASNPANSVQQAFSSLQQDLQAGNLSAAQQDFATLQQSLQNAGGRHLHHHHHGGGSQQLSTIEQELNSLSQALQSGNLSGAQTAFATLQQQLQQSPFGSSAAASTSTTSASANSAQTAGSSLNVTV